MRVRIINTSSDRVLAGEAVVLRGAFSKALGLMGRRKTGGALFVLQRESRVDATIHMMFMLIPLDVVWVDKKFMVVDVRTVMPVSPLDPRTWIFHTPRKRAKYIIELSAGAAGKTKVGDEIQFKFFE